MQLPAQRIVAVEITPTRMNLAEVEPGRMPKVYAWATVEVPDSSATADQLREALHTGGFKARRAYVALPIPVEVRHLSLPALSRSELRRVVEREARREGAIPPDERIFDFAVVGETGERGAARKKEVLLAVTSEWEVSRYTSLIEEAGLIPWLTTSRPLALIAALDLHTRGDGPVVVASVQGTFLQIMVAEGGILYFNREITLPALPGGEGAESWEGVVTDVQRSMLYFLQRFPARQIRRVVLTGDSGDLIGLQQALAEDPSVRVEVFDPTGRVEVLAPSGEGPAWRAALPSLAIPLGLASGRLSVGINLLPRQVQERKWGVVRRVAMGIVVTATVVIGSISLVVLSLGEQNLDAALQSHLTALSSIQEQLREVEEVERQRGLHRARLALLEGGLWRGPVWRGVLREISFHAPPGLLLHNLKLDAGLEGYRIVLKGEVTSRSPYQANAAFSRFYEGLQRSPFLARVTLLQPLKVSRVLLTEARETTAGVEQPKGTQKTAAPFPEERSQLEFSLALTMNGE